MFRLEPSLERPSENNGLRQTEGQLQDRRDSFFVDIYTEL